MKNNENDFQKRLLDSIVVEIIEYLDEYDLDVNPNTLFTSLEEITAMFMLTSGEDKHQALQVLEENRTIIAKDMAEQILFGLAEERPGTDPYSHERNIPIPISFAIVLSNTLSMMVDLALSNDNIEKAKRISSFLYEYTDAIATHAIKELIPGAVDNSPIGEEGSKFLPGPHIMMQQPVLAQIARMIILLISSMESGQTSLRLLDPKAEEESIKVFIIDFKKQVILLDILRERFGTRVNPENENF